MNHPIHERIAELEHTFEATLDALQGVNANAAVHTTGGGCMAILIPLDDDFEKRILITGAWQEPDGWFTDADLPEEDNDDTRWAIGVDSEQHPSEDPTFPLTRTELVRKAAIIVTAEAALTEVAAADPTLHLERWDGQTFASLHGCFDANELLEDLIEYGLDAMNEAIAYMEESWK